MASEDTTSLREALSPSALRSALAPQRPVFANPWDSTPDIFACYLAVSLVDPFLLWAGGKLMGPIFGFGTHWHLGVFMFAAVVGAAGFMTIVGRQRSNLSVDFIAVTAWILLGIVLAPILGLGLSTVPAIICYAVLLLANFVFVLSFGRWRRELVQMVTWPTMWSLLALLFAFIGYRMVFFQ